MYSNTTKQIQEAYNHLQKAYYILDNLYLDCEDEFKCDVEEMTNNLNKFIEDGFFDCVSDDIVNAVDIYQIIKPM